MRQYQQLIKDILERGENVNDRTGTGTRSIFGYQMRFNLQDGFPAVTTKKLAWKAVVGELIWFLEGSDDERRLAELTYGKPREELVGKHTIWTANADNQGKQLGYVNNDTNKCLGPIYGAQWRAFGADINNIDGFDQIKWLIKEIRANPDSRRLILSAWCAGQIWLMALPPCHTMAQFRVINGRLNCQMYQRSADVGLGVPFNIASYALLTHIIARETGLEVGDYVHTIGDAHIYNDHISSMEELLTREPYELPKLVINKDFNLDEGLTKFNIDSASMFTLDGYKYHPSIKMDMAV